MVLFVIELTLISINKVYIYFYQLLVNGILYSHYFHCKIITILEAIIESSCLPVLAKLENFCSTESTNIIMFDQKMIENMGNHFAKSIMY